VKDFQIVDFRLQIATCNADFGGKRDAPEGGACFIGKSAKCD
jgi:hypothetical protein